MKIAVLDAAFPIDSSNKGLGARFCSIWLRRNGAQEVDPADAKVILVSCLDVREYRFVRRVRLRWPSAQLFVGGGCSNAPHVLGEHCDGVCVGEGARFIETLCRQSVTAAQMLPNVWIDGEERPVMVDGDFPWNLQPIEGEDGTIRLWAGRGCKKMCHFCSTGWGREFVEQPKPGELRKIATRLLTRGERVSFISNDLGQHSFYAGLPNVSDGSYSIDSIKHRGLPKARQVRLGIEGVSERLRKLIGKPIQSDELVQITSWLSASGKSVRWFLIAGLPTEADHDWEELKRAVQEWKLCTPKGVLALSFTALNPHPSTPIGILPLDDSYWARFEIFREWFFGGKGWSNRVKIMQPAQPASRLKTAMVTMGLSEEELYEGGNWGPNDRISYPHKDARNRLARFWLAKMGLTPELANG